MNYYVEDAWFAYNTTKQKNFMHAEGCEAGCQFSQ